MTQLITLHLPGSLYQRLTECARQAHRSVEDELMEIVATAVRDDDLPADLSSTLASLPFLDDQALWRAARSRLPVQAVARMQALHDKRDVEGLTAAEQESLAMLPRQNDRSMLVRARAAELLHQRGHDVSSLIESW
jgi:plasmid stability protein